jgi:hypothetical protein
MKGKIVAGSCSAHGFWTGAERCPQCEKEHEDKSYKPFAGVFVKVAGGTVRTEGKNGRRS